MKITKAQSGQIVGGALKSTISLNDLDKAFPELFGVDATPTTANIYSTVSWMYRCVNLRCDTLSAIPHALFREGDENPLEEMPAPYQDVDMERLIWLTEAARCLWGASYWEKDATLHWLNPSTMSVEVQNNQIAAFRQATKGTPTTWAPDELVYLPLFGPSDDLGPGVAPASVALRAAGLSGSLLQWAESFFAHGAVPLVLLTTEQSLAQDDPNLQRIKAMWKKLFGGAAKAWETGVLSKGLTPTILSSPVRDLAIPELSDEVREDLAACFGIPITMLQQAAANYATAKEDVQGYHINTNFPEAGRIQSGMNKQLWKPLGYEFRFLTDEVEAIQQNEAEKAEGITALMGAVTEQLDKKILTRERAVFLSERLWDQMGMPFPEDMPDEEPEPEPAPVIVQAPPNEVDDETPQPPNPGTPPEAAQRALDHAALMRKDLGKWARKASKRGGDCPFESDNIPAWATKAVHMRLLADPETAFDPFLGGVKAYPMGTEKALAASISEIYARQLPGIVRAVRAGKMPALTALNTQLRGVLIQVLQQVAAERTLAEGAALGWGIEYDELLMNSETWARDRADEAVRLTQKTNQARLQGIIGDVTSDKITPEVAESLASRLFNGRRAEGIAAYETSSALSEASHELAGSMRTAGIQVIERWLTAEDERVCPICGPLDKAVDDEWSSQFPSGPPAHVNCRCMLVVEYR